MKLLLSRRLRSRLAFKQTLSFALLVMVLAWSAYALLARRIYNQLDGELQDRAIAVRSMLQIRNGEVRWLHKEADAEVRQQFGRAIRYFQLLGDGGRPIETSRELTVEDLPFTRPAHTALISGRIGWETVSLSSGATLRILDSPVSGTGQQHYLLRVGMSTAEAQYDTSHMGLFILALLPFIILLQGVSSWWMAGDVVRPLEQLSAAARQIKPFDNSHCLPVFGTGDEIDQLSATVNGTLVRQQASFQRMSEFLRNLSHEIRQPLTIMRAEAEQALRAADPNHNMREMLASQLQHVELLARTVSDLMELAHSDSDEVQLNRQTEDLSELVQAAIDGMRIKSGEQNIHISGAVQQNVIGQFDAGQLWRLILNLLHNAMKFSGPEGRIDVALTAHNNLAIVSVTDTGCGIAAEDQSRIFDRGYRTSLARASAVPGTGLGLHFARTIAHAHGGNIEVISAPGKGSCFRVSLPLSPTLPASSVVAESCIN